MEKQICLSLFLLVKINLSLQMNINIFNFAHLYKERIVLCKRFIEI